jgi:acyl-CoA thioesterase-1
MIRRSIAAALLSIILIAASPPPERPVVLAFGDSLTAGYGLDQGLGFAPQLEAMLRRHGIKAEVVDGASRTWSCSSLGPTTCCAASTPV